MGILLQDEVVFTMQATKRQRFSVCFFIVKPVLATLALIRWHTKDAFPVPNALTQMELFSKHFTYFYLNCWVQMEKSRLSVYSYDSLV